MVVPTLNDSIFIISFRHQTSSLVPLNANNNLIPMFFCSWHSAVLSHFECVGYFRFHLSEMLKVENGVPVCNLLIQAVTFRSALGEPIRNYPMGSFS